MDQASYIKQVCSLFHELQKPEQNASELWKRLLETKEGELPAAQYIKQCFHLSELAYFALLHGIAYAIDAEVAKASNAMMSVHSLCTGVTMTYYSRFTSITYADVLSLDTDAMKLLLIPDEEAYPLMRRITIRKDILHYLITGCMPIHPYIRYFYQEEPYAMIYETQLARLLRYLQESETILLTGLTGTGKHTLLKRAAIHLNRVLLFLDMRIWNHLSPSNREDSFASLLAFAKLHNALLCLEHYTTQDQAMLEILLYYLSYYDQQALLLGDIVPNISCPLIALPPHLSREDAHCLQAFFKMPSIQQMASHYSPQDLLENARCQQDAHMDYEHNIQLPSNIQAYCHIVKQHTVMQDWLGSNELKEQLQHLIYILKHHHEIEQTVSFQASYTILFHGPSGTGKTMATSIIGNETGFPVWQINVSSILDKYIGESEKHLEQVFEEAQKQNVILLFDEADVLFSRRTNISSSNDRYANSSTAYLLQKLEQYDGIVILTSNLMQNFDDAFLRRLRYILRFPQPSKEARELKWKQCFQNLPLETELPYEHLAELTALSLAQINNVCEHAQYYWMEEGCEKLCLRHLQNALQLELQKKQSSLPKDFLRQEEESVCKS